MISKFIDIKGQHVHYLEGGSGKIIVLLPSLWITSRPFENIGIILSKKFHVIIPDLFKGQSKYTHSARSFNDYCRVLNDFFEKLTLSDVVLIGMSYSGLIVSFYVQKYPNKLKKVFLFSSTAIPFVVNHPIWAMFIGYIKLFLCSIFSIKELIIFISWVYDGLCYFARHPIQFLLEPSLILNFQKSKKTTRFPIPTKLFVANKDEFMNPDVIKEVNKGVKNLSVDIINGKHAWFFYEADRFLNVISEAI